MRGQALLRSTIVTPTSTTRSTLAALGTLDDEARGMLPILVPSMCTVVSAGCSRAAKSRSPKPTTASWSGHSMPARCASRQDAMAQHVGAADTRRSRLSRLTSSASAPRPMPSSSGRYHRRPGHRRSGAPWPARNASARRGALVAAVDDRQPAAPAACRNSATASPIVRARSPRACRAGRGEVPGLDDRDPGAERRLRLGRMHHPGQHDAVRAAGPMIASSSASSRFPLAGCPSIS